MGQLQFPHVLQGSLHLRGLLDTRGAHEISEEEKKTQIISQFQHNVDKTKHVRLGGKKQYSKTSSKSKRIQEDIVVLWTVLESVDHPPDFVLLPVLELVLPVQSVRQLLLQVLFHQVQVQLGHRPPIGQQSLVNHLRMKHSVSGSVCRVKLLEASETPSMRESPYIWLSKRFKCARTIEFRFRTKKVQCE